MDHSNPTPTRPVLVSPSCSTKPDARIKAIAESAEVPVNVLTPLSCYVRSGKEMIRSASNYHEDGSLENAYLLYMRFLIIFVEKIQKHPGYSSLPAPEKKIIKNLCRDALPKTEILKKDLLAQFEIEYNNYLTNEEILKQEQEDAERKQQEELEREARYKHNLALLNETIANIDVTSAGKRGTTSIKPSAPPYQPIIRADSADYPPRTNYADSNHYTDAKSVEQNGTSVPIPAFDRSSKPSRILSPISAGMRNVMIPGNLVPEFVKIAQSNTLANIETCGILAGKIIREELVITHLIIPKQRGTPDSCTTENEEQIFGYQDKFNLITIGWIHTHPTQTAFLSSVDLHTHYSYQLMMPEAIAIVCAPGKNETGIFMLNSYGMDTIGSCTATGFHPHSTTSNPIFQDASHADYDRARTAAICDLRFQS